MAEASAELDVLAIAAHPDDAELFAGGTLARIAAAGHRTGILNLTRGEAATVGSPEDRARESEIAAKILSVGCVHQMDLGDGLLANSDEQRQPVAGAIRQLRPRLVLTHSPEDRHPDHRATHELVRDAVFFANVAGYGAAGDRWKVEALAWWPGNTLNPDPRADWVVDITGFWNKKLDALGAFVTQFRREGSNAQTYIGSEQFWGHLERRARMWGHFIGSSCAEPFVLDRPASSNHPLIRLTL